MHSAVSGCNAAELFFGILPSVSGVIWATTPKAAGARPPRRWAGWAGAGAARGPPCVAIGRGRACNVARLRPKMPLTTADAPDERAEDGRCGRRRGYGALTAAGAAERRRDRPAQWPGPAGAAARKPRQGQRGQPVAREELRATAGADACCITGPPAGGVSRCLALGLSCGAYCV